MRCVVRPRPLAFWALTLGAAVLTGTTVTTALGRAEADQRSGRRQPTLVVTAPVAAGEALTVANTTVTLRAAGERPAGALDREAPGAVATGALVPGEAVVAERLGGAGLSPVAALLPAGHRGVAVPVPEGALPLSPGDHVDLVATLPVDLSGPGGGTGVVAEAAVIIQVDGATVVAGVPVSDVDALATALAEGTVLVVLRGSG